jgi:hypothetical protein
MLRIPLLGLLALCLLSACGSDYDTKKVKSYRLAVMSDDANMKREFRSLIQDYNRLSQLNVLEYAEDAAGANSVIVVTEGLQTRDGKVGWGQWMAESQAENPMTKLPGDKAERTITYSMRVEFDAEYMRRGDLYAKQKLFFHEVGHGLEMDHVPSDMRDVMYPDVAGDKDFEEYFTRVRMYMSDRE